MLLCQKQGLTVVRCTQCRDYSVLMSKPEKEDAFSVAVARRCIHHYRKNMTRMDATISDVSVCFIRLFQPFSPYFQWLRVPPWFLTAQLMIYEMYVLIKSTPCYLDSSL